MVLVVDQEVPVEELLEHQQVTKIPQTVLQILEVQVEELMVVPVKLQLQEMVEVV